MSQTLRDLDAGVLRGVIGAADFKVASAQARVLLRVAAGVAFTEAQRDGARELAELTRANLRLSGLQLRCDDAALLERRVEVRMQADTVLEQASAILELFSEDIDFAL